MLRNNVSYVVQCEVGNISKLHPTIVGQKQMTAPNRSPKELAIYFVIGIAISFVTTAIVGNLNVWIRLVISILPSVIVLAVRKNFKSRGFLSSIGHTIPYSIAMFVFEQPLIDILEP